MDQICPKWIKLDQTCSNWIFHQSKNVSIQSCHIYKKDKNGYFILDQIGSDLSILFLFLNDKIHNYNKQKNNSEFYHSKVPHPCSILCLVIFDYNWGTWLKLVMLENVQACFSYFLSYTLIQYKGHNSKLKFSNGVKFRNHFIFLVLV